MDKDLYFRSVFITAWCDFISQDQLLHRFQELPLKNICIGAIEKTEKEKEHFHVVATFYSGIRFSTFKNISSCLHIERLKTSGANVYSLKEGCFYNDFDLEINTSNNIFTDLINDMLVLEWRDIVRKYPKIVINHYTNIKNMYDDINSNDN